MFKNLHELIATMPDDKTCREFLVQQRWPDGKVICPYCGYGKCYVIEGGKRFKCGSSNCYKKFSATVGTVFEASNVPLNKWFMAVFLCSAHKKGISSHQLGRDIGVCQKTAWFMLHRIRELMRPKENIKLDNIVEVDEVYIGGKVGNMSKQKRTKLREEGRTYDTKTMVMGMIERGGELKLITIGKSNNIMALQPTIRDNVDKDAVIITDSLGSYTGLNKEFAGHEIVNHSEHEYVRDGVIHTNSIEGAFSLLRRSIYGIYHQVTPKHLSRYCDETMFRYNSRKMKDRDRFTYSLKKSEGRLTYKNLVKRNEIEKAMSLPQENKPTEKRKWERRAVLQIKNGEVVAQYESPTEAAKQTGIKYDKIVRILNGKKITTGGFHWKYL